MRSNWLVACTFCYCVGLYVGACILYSNTLGFLTFTGGGGGAGIKVDISCPTDSYRIHESDWAWATLHGH